MSLEAIAPAQLLTACVALGVIGLCVSWRRAMLDDHLRTCDNLRNDTAELRRQLCVGALPCHPPLAVSLTAPRPTAAPRSKTSPTTCGQKPWG
jgi:hypothetical protein